MSKKFAVKSAPRAARHTLVNPRDAESVTFESGSHDERAEDYDGPVMLVTRNFGGEVFTGLMIIEEARAMYADYLRRGWKKAA